jgi:Domain of unknown function (DUF5679)
MSFVGAGAHGKTRHAGWLKNVPGAPRIEGEAVRETASGHVWWPGQRTTKRSGDDRADRGGGTPMAKYEAYCVKCKAKREFDGEETTLKNGRRAAKGTCPVCGTTVMRILGKAS